MNNEAKKTMVTGEDARKQLQAGVDAVANIVKTTMGPRGKVVVFNRGAGPIFSLDGITVAKQVELSDEAQNDGAQLAISAARDTDKQAGDGTTCATVLVQSLFSQGMKALSVGIDHTKLIKGMEEAKDFVKAEVRKVAKQIKAKEDIKNVATISSRDEEVGEKIAELYYKLGKEAVITVEESKTLGVHTEIVEGIEIESGFIAPHFMTNIERGEAILEDAYILCTSQVISTNQDMAKVLEAVLRERKPLLVIAEDVRGEALATMVINKLQGRLLSVAVKAPGMGDNKREQIEDIAVLTGGVYLTEETSMRTDDAELAQLGRAERIVVAKDKTIIIGGKGKKKDITDRISFIEQSAEKETAEYLKEMKERRAAKLKGGIAVMRVGTVSLEENMEKRYRVEDAVRSAKSAMEEGVVQGAGMALFSISKMLEKRIAKEMDLAIRTGLDIVCQAIKEPARQIIKNTNENADVILSRCEGEKGWDSSTGEYCDLAERGILDPAKVVRCALENAISAVKMFLSTEAVIFYEAPPEKNEK